MKTFKTIASHRTEYEHPIKLKKGESVTLGGKSSGGKLEGLDMGGKQ